MPLSLIPLLRINPAEPNATIARTSRGEVRERSMRVVTEKGILISAYWLIPKEIVDRYGSGRAVFFLVEVNTSRPDKIRELFDAGKLSADVGTVLQLDQAKTTHESWPGSPHPRGKIILNVSG